MALSDSLSRLASQTKEFEDTVAATTQKNQENVQARLSAVKDSIEITRTSVGADLAAAGDEAANEWNELQKSVSEGFDSLRSKAAARHSAHVAQRAGRDADWAENDAVDAVDFAVYAIQEAEYAILDASAARAAADEAAHEVQA